MMPILVKSDDVRSGRKAKARHGRLRPALVVNGLTSQVYASTGNCCALMYTVKTHVP